MTATAILSAPFTVRPLLPAHVVLPDPRPARGKHRARRSLSAVFCAWRVARVEFAVGAASVGAVAAAVLS